MHLHLKETAAILFVLILPALTNTAYSQNKEGEKDTLKIYRNMEKFAMKHKFTYTIYKAFFLPVSTLNEKKSEVLKIVSYKKFKGKIIRNIHIASHDPFGYDLYDTLVKPSNFWEKSADALHIKSVPFAIRNQLLFHEGDSLDEFKIKESERLLRATLYVREVFIYPVKVGNDSVDIVIREIDKWSIIPGISGSLKNLTIQLSENNFLGSGHRLDNSVQFVPHNNNIYTGVYNVPNFKNTFISTSVFFKSDFDSVFYKGISIQRKFYSPLTKWAGGVLFSNNSITDSLYLNDSINVIPNVRFNQYDTWLGKSFPLFKKFGESNRNTNLILTLRYLNTDYLTKPLLTNDTYGLYTDEQFYLAGIGISQRIYLKDTYIFKFGLPEDVPTGQVISFVIGSQQHTGLASRLYLGMRVGWGNYIGKAGYFAANVEYGTYKNESHLERGVFSADFTYFTNLLEIGKWKFRQFIKPKLTIGYNRYPNDVLTINDNYGIQGFNTPLLYGTKRFVLSTQLQAYAPYTFLGFRFAPVIYFTGALLSTDNRSIFKSRFYSSFGFGILFRNEMLVLNTFQISIAFYPIIPGISNNLLKFNSLKSYNFLFRDFDIEQPEPINFR